MFLVQVFLSALVLINFLSYFVLATSICVMICTAGNGTLCMYKVPIDDIIINYDRTTLVLFVSKIAVGISTYFVSYGFLKTVALGLIGTYAIKLLLNITDVCKKRNQPESE